MKEFKPGSLGKSAEDSNVESLKKSGMKFGNQKPYQYSYIKQKAMEQGFDPRNCDYVIDFFKDELLRIGELAEKEKTKASTELENIVIRNINKENAELVKYVNEKVNPQEAVKQVEVEEAPVEPAPAKPVVPKPLKKIAPATPKGPSEEEIKKQMAEIIGVPPFRRKLVDGEQKLRGEALSHKYDKQEIEQLFEYYLPRFLKKEHIDIVKELDENPPFFPGDGKKYAMEKEAARREKEGKDIEPVKPRAPSKLEQVLHEKTITQDQDFSFDKAQKEERRMDVSKLNAENIELRDIIRSLDAEMQLFKGLYFTAFKHTEDGFIVSKEASNLRAALSRRNKERQELRETLVKILDERTDLESEHQLSTIIKKLRSSLDKGVGNYVRFKNDPRTYKIEEAIENVLKPIEWKERNQRQKDMAAGLNVEDPAAMSKELTEILDKKRAIKKTIEEAPRSIIYQNVLGVPQDIFGLEKAAEKGFKNVMEEFEFKSEPVMITEDDALTKLEELDSSLMRYYKGGRQADYLSKRTGAKLKYVDGKGIVVVGGSPEDLDKCLTEAYNNVTEIIDLRNTVEAKNRQIEKQQNLILKTEKENEGLKTKRDSLIDAKEGLEKKVEEANAKDKEQQGKISELEETNSTLKTRTSALDKETNDLRSKVEEAEEKETQYQNQISELENKNESLEGRVKDEEGKYTELEEEYDQLKINEELKKQAVEQLKAEKTILEIDKLRLQEDLEREQKGRDKELKEYGKNVRKLQKDLEDAKKSLEDLGKDKKTKKDIAAINDTLDRMEKDKELQEKDKELQKKNKKIKNLEEKIIEKDREIEDLEKRPTEYDLADVRSRNKDLIDRYEGRVKEFVTSMRSNASEVRKRHSDELEFIEEDNAKELSRYKGKVGKLLQKTRSNYKEGIKRLKKYTDASSVHAIDIMGEVRSILENFLEEGQEDISENELKRTVERVVRNEADECNETELDFIINHYVNKTIEGINIDKEMESRLAETESRLKEARFEEVFNLTLKYEGAIRNIKKKHDREIAVLVNADEARLSKVKERYDRELQTVHRDFKGKIDEFDEVKRKWIYDVLDLQLDNEAFAAEIKELKTDKTELKSKIKNKDKWISLHRKQLIEERERRSTAESVAVELDASYRKELKENKDISNYEKRKVEEEFNKDKIRIEQKLNAEIDKLKNKISKQGMEICNLKRDKQNYGDQAWELIFELRENKDIAKRTQNRLIYAENRLKKLDKEVEEFRAKASEYIMDICNLKRDKERYGKQAWELKFSDKAKDLVIGLKEICNTDIYDFIRSNGNVDEEKETRLKENVPEELHYVVNQLLSYAKSDYEKNRLYGELESTKIERDHLSKQLEGIGKAAAAAKEGDPNKIEDMLNMLKDVLPGDLYTIIERGLKGGKPVDSEEKKQQSNKAPYMFGGMPAYGEGGMNVGWFMWATDNFSRLNDKISSIKGEVDTRKQIRGYSARVDNVEQEMNRFSERVSVRTL